ncbi:MAG: cyclic beta 1-2 glucan synthetase, partial [Deltaproteobacteria bacterium]|nr:cyclic beta 1-2 glucan synthetase [Deltaproteobacteria bacterium]
MTFSDLGLPKSTSVFGNIIAKPKALGKRADRRPFRPRDAQPLTRDGLHEHARLLAKDHRAAVINRRSRRLTQRFSEHCRDLDNAYNMLGEAAANKESLTPGAEWLLDNYHIVQQQIQDIRKHFPEGYDRTLPKLVSGPYAGYPRVYHIAIEFLVNSDSVVGADILSSFVDGYQQEIPLTIGELWAVPIMLRFALIENLAALAGRMQLMREERKDAETLIDDIVGDDSQQSTQMLLELAAKLVERPDFLPTGAPYLLRRLRERGRKAALTVQWLEERIREEGLEPEEVIRNEQYILAADQISIGNSFTSLKALSYIDWKVWVESASRVHSVLLGDPAKIYHHCDFKTRDLYRREIERLAKHSSRHEIEVAQTAISLATTDGQRAKEEGRPELFVEKRSHVGFYLVGVGRDALEQALSYRTSPLFQLLRRSKRRPFALYVGVIELLTLIIALRLTLVAREAGGNLLETIVVSILALLLCSEIAITIFQWIVTRFTPPAQLPKLDFRRGIPETCKTVVVVQALFTDVEAVARTFEGLEVRYLANAGANLVFGVLADFPDSLHEIDELDEVIRRAADDAVETLSRRHPDARFFVLFRRRQFNPGQDKFMGWERKRGKIEEFNHLLEGSADTTFIVDRFERSLLENVRYVITLDNDSQLPRESALKLIGAIAHPLNAPLVETCTDDPTKHRISEGYSIL